MIKLVYFVLFGILCFNLSAQNQDDEALFIKEVFDFTLSKSDCYNNLKHLCKEIGPRLSGTNSYDEAVKYGISLLTPLSDTVYEQPCLVNAWQRGENESLELIYEDGKKESINMLSLGFSIGTEDQYIIGDIIEVNSLDEVRSLGRENLEGKVVFYNRPMDPTKTNTFSAYGGAVDQRVYGATTASEYGAIASITRSMSVNNDDVPHTGTLFYKENTTKIPGISVSTNDANKLSKALTKGMVRAKINTQSKSLGQKKASTVIGEIKGSEFPNEIILVGGHLDSWDVGEGAHDDGTGVVQSIQVFETLKALDYKPKRTLRCVLFANEESGLAGGRKYAEVSNKNTEYHLAAIESDRGGFIPTGFSFEGHEDTFTQFYQSVSKWSGLFETYGIQFSNGGSGADIGPLKGQKGLLVGLKPDSQRYFDFHHTHEDVFEVVNKRELEMGASAMAALVYLLDKYGLK